MQRTCCLVVWRITRRQKQLWVGHGQGPLIKQFFQYQGTPFANQFDISRMFPYGLVWIFQNNRALGLH